MPLHKYVPGLFIWAIVPAPLWIWLAIALCL